MECLQAEGRKFEFPRANYELFRIENGAGGRVDHPSCERERKLVMQTYRVWLTPVIGVSLLTMTLGTNPVGAQEFSASNRVLKKTYLKTRADEISLSTIAFENIFTPTSITCPRTAGTCTVRIEVSVVMSPTDDSYEGVWLRAVVGGVIAPILAAPGEVSFYEHYVGPTGHPYTFSWISTGFVPGSRTISVQAAKGYLVNDVTVRARTLTVEVYTP
jgi:hypothetical protein